jgi:ATP-dependent Clp protease ATP-binding subunit ClpB
MMKIIDLRLKEVQERLVDRKITLELNDEAKNYLVSIGYSPQYGARPLNRAIQTELLNPLSLMLLADRIHDGEVVRSGFDGPRNRLVIYPNHEGQQVDDMDIDNFDDDIDIEEMD